MKLSVLLVVLLTLFAGIAEARHVNSYTRKDGTTVSSYDTGSSHSSSGPSGGGSVSDIFSDSSTLLILVGIVVAVVVVALIIKAISTEGNSAVQVDNSKMKAYAASLELNGFRSGQFTPPETPLVLLQGEVPILHRAATLMEAKAVRFYGGVGTRIKGIYIGGGASTPVDGLTRIDTGTLTLTTQRLVFDGQMQNRNMSVSQVLSMKTYSDAIEIASAKRAKSQVYLVDNPVLWKEAISLATSGGVNLKRKTPESEAVAEPAPPADIHFACDKCGQHLVVNGQASGKIVHCTSCQAKVTVPACPAVA